MDIKPKYAEHKIYKKTFSCGHGNVSDCPIQVETSISYEYNIQATIAYLHTRKYLPYERMSAFFANFCNLLQNVAEKAKPSYAIMQQNLNNTPSLEQMKWE